MPFKSEVQRAWMYANNPKLAKSLEKKTKEKELPLRSKGRKRKK